LLTADLVEVRRRGAELHLRALDEEDRSEALVIADAYVGLVKAHVGRTRAQLLEACRAVPVSARRRKLGAGLFKLVLDGCVFEEAATLDPAHVRAEVFAAATRHRRSLGARAEFDRTVVLAEVAARHTTSPAALEQALYADLPEAQVLVTTTLTSPAALVAAYEAAGVQAVLLRAVRVRARVRGASPAAYRQLFRKLKFLRLLHQIEPLPAPATKNRAKATGEAPAGYEITIDGPYSLFESVTRYGLQLALAYPVIAACGRWEIEADLRWGKDRQAYTFNKRGEAFDAATDAEAAPGRETLLPETRTLLDELERLPEARFAARPSTRLVALPGAGVIAPDLELSDRKTGRTVLVEVLGFWSRDAVWRRIELAEKGLPEPLIFAVSKHLRVSEAALPESDKAALYVYANKLSARAIVERAETLIG
jgi:uncharacterized protein